MTLTNHLLTPSDDYRKLLYVMLTSHGSTDGSYLKGDNGKYYAGMLLQLLLMLWRHHLYLWLIQPKSLTQTCTSAKDKTAYIYTDNRYACGVTRDLGMLWKQHVFLTSNGNKI